MMPEGATDTNSNESEAEKLARLLELELIQKRAAWKRAGARHRNARMMSFAFLTRSADSFSLNFPQAL